MTSRTGMATALRKCIPVHFTIPGRSGFSSSIKRRCFTTRQGTLLPARPGSMERAGKLQCVIDSNIYDKALRGGCRLCYKSSRKYLPEPVPRCKKVSHRIYCGCKTDSNLQGLQCSHTAHDFSDWGDGGQSEHDQDHRGDNKGGYSVIVGDHPGFRGVLPVHTVFCRAEHGNHT